jgi:hypothetical protein
MLSAAVACLPAAVSLLLQISWVSLVLTWPCRLCLLRVFLCASATSFPLSKHTGEGDTAPTFSCQLPCLFTVHVERRSSLLSCGVFLPLPLSQAPGCWARTSRSHHSLSCLPGLFIYSSEKDSLPPIFGAQCTPPSFLCVFIVLIAY